MNKFFPEASRAIRAVKGEGNATSNIDASSPPGWNKFAVTLEPNGSVMHVKGFGGETTPPQYAPYIVGNRITNKAQVGNFHSTKIKAMVYFIGIKFTKG
jgi:hypothetical protein